MKISMTLFLLVTCAIVHAQELGGSYTGTLKVQGMELELIYNITKSEDGYVATLDVPAQGASGIEMDSVVLEGNEVSIQSAKMQMSFVGKLAKESIVGTYEQMGQHYPLSLNKTVKKLPGNTDLPSSEEELRQLVTKESGTFKYTVEDYFKTPEAFSFQLSPDGNIPLLHEKKRDRRKRCLPTGNRHTKRNLVDKTRGGPYSRLLLGQ